MIRFLKFEGGMNLYFEEQCKSLMLKMVPIIELSKYYLLNW